MPHGLEGTGARDWAEFGVRINFIADLFRVFPQDPDLFRAPFTSTRRKSPPPYAGA